MAAVGIIYMSVSLTDSIKACYKNAQRILCDVKKLEETGTAPTRYYLSIIAQEECAKAFLLHLVDRNIISWNPEVHAASRDHIWKQLLCEIIRYINPNDSDLLERLKIKMCGENGFETPDKILDVVRLFKNGRFKDRRKTLKDIVLEESVDSIARGARDGEKQSGLYVNLTDRGLIATIPDIKITAELAEFEYKIAWGFIFFLSEIISTGKSANYFYGKIVEELKGALLTGEGGRS